MNFYTQKVVTLIMLTVFLFFENVNAQHVKFEKSESFFPNAEILKEQKIDWGYLTVPENWDKPEKRKIKIAVAVLKNFSQNKNPNVVVFIQGGPGAANVANITTWLNHPLRENNDIVILDIRGTGLSEPRLCPELGNEFLQILAKNQSKAEDEKQKTAAAMLCKQELLNKGVDIEAYNSLSVAKDLHALKQQLKYSKWNVYGVSYGTYMAQVYANAFPEDIKSLILDSVIDNITNYYTENTSNYMKSLLKVFEECKKNPNCNAQYPDLEAKYYETIAQLQKNPLTVEVDKNLVETGKFTFNEEDFKVAVQQALYHKQLVEVIPLLIYQANQRNKGALGNLVAAFSSLLSMDYGVYYCVSCNETLPVNDISAYEKDAAKFKKLSGGVSFYKSDFKVCEKWNEGKNSKVVFNELNNLNNATFPVLILSGGYDPITPVDNGEALAKKLQNGTVLIASTYGHTPSFTAIGNEIVSDFIDEPNKKPDLNAYDKANKVNFANQIEMNAGISKMGNSLSQLNIFFISPLIIAIFVMLGFIVIYLINFFNKKYTNTSDKIIRILSVLTSVAGLFVIVSFILAILNVSKTNLYILAFGLPAIYNYLYTSILIFIGLLILTLAYFFIKVKKIDERSIVFSVIFSNLLLLIYMMYWGILPFNL